MPASATVRRKRVLVVDDDEPLNGSMRRKFERLGLATEGVLTGKAALELMRREHFDGILLDLRLPREDLAVDKNGFDVLRERATTLNAATPVFVLTSADEKDRDLARQLGATKTFDKLSMPSPQSVAEQVTQVLTAA